MRVRSVAVCRSPNRACARLCRVMPDESGRLGVWYRRAYKKEETKRLARRPTRAEKVPASPAACRPCAAAGAERPVARAAGRVAAVRAAAFARRPARLGTGLLAQTPRPTQPPSTAGVRRARVRELPLLCKNRCLCVRRTENFSPPAAPAASLMGLQRRLRRAQKSAISRAPGSP